MPLQYLSTLCKQINKQLCRQYGTVAFSISSSSSTSDATMSERKVLSKYYPPDFDPSKITRSRAPKQAGPKVQTVRLMAPFPMKCTACGEYIYKGRKFNARKETTEEKYYSIPIYRFYIRCTRCSGEITFKTDPKKYVLPSVLNICIYEANMDSLVWTTSANAAQRGIPNHGA